MSRSLDTLEQIVMYPPVHGRARILDEVLNWTVLLPSCVALGLAVHQWEAADKLSSGVSLILGALWGWLVLVISRRRHEKQMGSARAELIARAVVKGYSKADYIACEERIDRFESSLSGELEYDSNMDAARELYVREQRAWSAASRTSWGRLLTRLESVAAYAGVSGLIAFVAGTLFNSHELGPVVAFGGGCLFFVGMILTWVVGHALKRLRQRHSATPSNTSLS